ncbi:MAG TPA: alpha/beta hydrolase [Cellulomonas sp.]
MSTGTTSTVGTGGGRIDWHPCEDLRGYVDLLGLDGLDRLECGEVEVPLIRAAPADPSAPRIALAVSRLARPTSSHDRAVLLNPGGPGLEGRTMPLLVDDATALADDADLIGVDVRGTGGSPTLPCPALEDLEAEEDVVVRAPQDAARRYAVQVEAANRDCGTAAPDLLPTLTTTTAARDLDAVRAALGLETIGFYGASWGTVLGAEYRTLFPERVGAMVLDSMTYLGGDAGTAVADVARALASAPQEPAASGLDPDEPDPDEPTPEAGAEEPDPEEAEADDGPVLPLEIVPFSVAARTAYTCSALAPVPSVPGQWAEHVALSADLGRDVADRVPFPSDGDVAGVSLCTGFAHPGPADPPRDTDAPLLVIGHRDDTVTPYLWSEQGVDLLGGTLLTVPDGAHGSALVTREAQVRAFLGSDGAGGRSGS